MFTHRCRGKMAPWLMLGLLAIMPRAHAQLNYNPSYVGNTGSYDAGTVPMQNQVSSLWVKPDGTCYTNTTWDENHNATGFYKNNAFVGSLADFEVAGAQAGWGVTGDANYIYCNDRGDIRRYNFNGSHANWNDSNGNSVWSKGLGIGGTVRGMSVDKTNSRLYVSVDSGTVQVYDTTNLAAAPTSFSVARPRECATKSDGTVWVISTDDATHAATIGHYRQDGTSLNNTITGPAGFHPTALCFDGSGNLLVADNGPDQCVKIYNSGNLGAAQPGQSSTFGAVGGIFSGTGSQIGIPDLAGNAPRFFGLTGIGVDGNGNIYIAQNAFGDDNNGTSGQCWQGSGGIISSYTYSLSSPSRNWQQFALEYIDCIAVDPSSENGNSLDVYSKYSHYNLNLGSTAPGSEFSWRGHTVNPIKYPGDPRFNDISNFDYETGYQVRTLGGKKFFFTTTMYGSHLAGYRFSSATDGEVAVPCVYVASDSIWRDGSNGSALNGAMDSGETLNGPGTPSQNGIKSYYVDINGDLWETYPNGGGGGSGVRHFTFQGLDGNGIPVWDYTHVESWDQPVPFSELYRAIYIPSTDTLYLAGYSANSGDSSRNLVPGISWNNGPYNLKAIGTVMARYDGWLHSGTRTANWRTILNYGGWPSGIAVAGSYAFVTYDGLASPLGPGYNDVFRLSDGVECGKMYPRNQGGSRTDTEFGINAFLRSNGEYLIFEEEDFHARVMMYRWTPPAAAPATPTLTATPGNTAVNLVWTTQPGTVGIYTLMRATSSSGPWTVIADELEGGSYTDNNNGGTLANGTTYYYKVVAHGPLGDAASSTVSAQPLASNTLKINCGGGPVADWIADAYYDTTDVQFTNNGGAAVNTSADPAPAPQAVYQAAHFNNTTYTIPGQTPGATYTVRLHFVEYNAFDGGFRNENVLINGATVLSNYRILDDAGGTANKAVEHEFTTTANSSGQIVIQFADVPGSTASLVQGIEIQQQGVAQTGSTPYSGTPAALPGTLEIENYDKGGEGTAYHETVSGGQTGYRTDNNSALYADSNASNTHGIGWTAAGQWLKYSVNAASASSYTIAFRVSSGASGGTFHLEDEAGNNLTGTVTAPATGGWGTYTTVTVTGIALSAGAHTLKLVEDSSGYNLDSVQFTAAASTATSFVTSFESGDPQPTWLDSIDHDFWDAASNPLNVSGYLSGVAPECSPRSEGTAHTGAAALMYSGTANGGSSTYCYCRVFDLSANPVTLTSASTLSYWLYPQQDNGRYVGLDFHCTDGTTLRDSGIVDQNGFSLHPNAGHGGSLPLNAWSQISANLGSLAGKKVDRLWVAFDHAGATGQYRGYLDDINLDPPAVPVTAPAAPAGVKAVAGNGQVSLSWSAVTGTGVTYEVIQGTAAGGESRTPLKTGLTGTSWVSTGLTNGTPYFYRVRAVRGSVYGAYSSEVSAKPVSAPSVPTGVSATAGAVGSKSITVKWTGSSGASGYTLYKASSSGGTYSQIGTATGLSYVNTGLTAGTTYYYKVAATNAGGASAQAGPTSAKAQ